MMKFLGKISLTLSLALLGLTALADPETNQSTLTIQQIMQEPRWLGSSPSRLFFSDNSRQIFFNWNPDNNEGDSLYVVDSKGGDPTAVSHEDRRSMPSRYGSYNQARSKKVYEKNGDLFTLAVKSGRITQFTNTNERESDPSFSSDETKIIFHQGQNLFSWQIGSGQIVQLTDFRNGREPEDEKPTGDEHDQWLQAEQMKLIATLATEQARDKRSEKQQENNQPKRPLEIYLGEDQVRNVQLSPDNRYILFYRSKKSPERPSTKIPNYVTESGYTDNFEARTKVGSPRSNQELWLYDLTRDTVYQAVLDSLPGIFDQPAYREEYQITDTTDSTEVDEETEPELRSVWIATTHFSDDHQRLLLDIRATDNKDRWLTELDCETGQMNLLDRQHDEAWVGGPALGSWYGGAPIGWLPDNQTIWFESEATGYAHLYTLDTRTGKKKQLTSGSFEIYSAELSIDKKWFFFSSNEVHFSERQFYRMKVSGGERQMIVSLTGTSDVTLSPDQKHLAFRHSYINHPWELYTQENRPGRQPKKLASSISDEFKAYPWRDPEMISFRAGDSAEVHANLYRPTNPTPGASAVIFVHGAGYTQNVRKQWGYYFREFMFHNLLADNGYYVLDIDYRGSAGYGRDWRTGIYRHMGGLDLSDQVDGAQYLINEHKVDPTKIGIYGGSYGGFITLMAMFNHPETFAAGAALRSVTDWAHYNHGYTANILNVPILDSLAYVRSSPIYFAEGLQGKLLICHGMLDANVQFQDVVRLAQRLIELGKDNWEMAVYPLEGHSFHEAASWRDEYQRIFELFEETLK